MIEAMNSVGEQALNQLLADPQVEEVMINGPHKAFVIANGRKVAHQLGFASDEELRAVIARMVSTAGRVLDEASPLVDARLPDGSRLNAVIAPLAPATTVTIRRFVLRELTLQDMVARGVLAAGPGTFLEAAVRSGINILICGGTSTGKTTLLGSLCSCIAPTERVVTIEETRELYLDHTLEDVCSLESRPMIANQITVRDLVKNALRMRPHRIIVGEVRGPEALDMLMAMTSGHEGSMCTLHADSAREALFKLHTFALMTGEGVPSAALHDMIARAIQLVIFCKRERDGDQRVIDTIFEVTGVQGGVISGQELWVQRNAELAWTGIRPQIETRLKERGHDLAKIFREPTGGWERRSHW
ncbi:MAG: CpaF family protein [Herpetosiphonaceae bacterium]|nr:CpaF family protein [Herpetosiphonaceae bacterium]